MDLQMVRKALQSVSAAQEWREKMLVARQSLPDGIGQQDVINWVVLQNPELDRLTYATRWKNAWLGRVADPEFTRLVEESVKFFQKQKANQTNRLKRQNLKKVQ
ncbi:hypothetical protein GCM10028818_00870 [Spirosoma horti]